MSGNRHGDGLAYELSRPQGEPRGGVVVLHGAGSCKENHRDFAQLCAAAGLAVVVFDQRGHGASDGALDGRAIADVATIASLLPGDLPLFLRGSSMGGFLALAAAASVEAAGVVAICPAGRELLLGGLREGRFDVRADRAALEQLIGAIDIEAAAQALGPRLLLVHAEGDDRVPCAHSRRLHLMAHGSRLVVVPGGDHHSAQHDPALQAEAIDFLVGLT
ncbi:MAG TPA: alpha/beta fold hydrolase [Solirubrobacteraceae bacterium]|nr:alpha/beta fold hydrolase [Solirubrobacteraceae bacterium]